MKAYKFIRMAPCFHLPYLTKSLTMPNQVTCMTCQ